VGLAVAALALSTLSVGTAAGATSSSPSTTGGVSATASAASGASKAAAAPSAVDSTPAGKSKCNTKFGDEAGAADNGIISNAGSLESSGAADIDCGKKKKGRTFGTVTVQGYFGDAGSTQFNVTVLKNCDGEPCDSGDPVCSTTGTGSPTGAAFPTFDTTKIKLDSKCVANKGSNWVTVQAATESAWYWRVTGNIEGNYPADWKEAGAFGTGCNNWENGRDMQSCIFGGDVGSPDFMLKLSK
jgi:hypothetical protein